jgi:hypothetical protein
MASKTVVKENDKVALYRVEAYYGNTTAQVEWRVFNKTTGYIIRESKTRKEALVWFDMCSVQA